MSLEHYEILFSIKFIKMVYFLIKAIRLLYFSLSTTKISAHMMLGMSLYFSPYNNRLPINKLTEECHSFHWAAVPARYVWSVLGSLSFARDLSACASATLSSLQLHDLTWELARRTPHLVLHFQRCLLAQHDVWGHPIPIWLPPASLHNTGCCLTL